MKKYFCHKIQNLLVINKIVTLHYFAFDKNFRSRGEAHDFWEIVYADKESILCTADGREIVLREGEALFHKPNEFHTLSANGQSDPCVLIVSFVSRSEAMRFFEGRQVFVPSECRRFLYDVLEEGKRTFNVPLCDPDAKKMELLASPALGGQQLVKNYLELFLISLMRALTEVQPGERTLSQRGDWNRRLVQYILQMMHEHIHEHLSIDEICKQTKYSRSYIFREFKSATGESLINHFNRMKMQEAARMLAEGAASVKDVSEALGFDTPNYFARTFRQFEGVTPSQYRAAHKVLKGEEV